MPEVIDQRDKDQIRKSCILSAVRILNTVQHLELGTSALRDLESKLIESERIINED